MRIIVFYAQISADYSDKRKMGGRASQCDSASRLGWVRLFKATKQNSLGNRELRELVIKDNWTL